MFRTFTLTFSFIRQRIRISLIRNRIKNINSNAYLDLWDRVELKKNIDLLKSLEQEEKFGGSSFFSLR